MRRWINKFTERSMGDTDYSLAQAIASMEYLETSITFKSLGITKEEFDKNVSNALKGEL